MALYGMGTAARTSKYKPGTGTPKRGPILDPPPSVKIRWTADAGITLHRDRETAIRRRETQDFQKIQRVVA